MRKWFRKWLGIENSKPSNTIGYANEGVVLALQIQADGAVTITIDTHGHGGIVPLQKPAQVTVTLEKEHLPVIQEWFANIDGAVTYVSGNGTQ